MDKSMEKAIPASPKDFQERISAKLLDGLDWVIEDRKNYYAKHPEAKTNPAPVDSIIAKYSNINAGISGGVGLIPGPWGMASAIPEVGLLLRNELAMIYDIGIAYGKSEDVLTKELLAGVLGSAIGAGGIGLLTIHGGKVLVRRASLRVFQRIVALLGGKITQRLLRAMISKWLPVVGAIAMATWSRYTTNAVGKKAREILIKEIEIDAQVIDSIKEIAEAVVEAEEVEAEDAFVVCDNVVEHRILALMNLMHVDGKVDPREMEYLTEIVSRSGIATDRGQALLKQAVNSDRAKVNWELFRASPDDSFGLMVDLVALAKRDEELHAHEKVYLKQVGRQLGFNESDLLELLTN